MASSQKHALGSDTLTDDTRPDQAPLPLVSTVSISMIDGAFLHGQIYHPAGEPPKGRWVKHRLETPLICLPNENGNAGIFTPFIEHLLSLEGCPERVISMDPRGCGDSDENKDKDYSPAMSADDFLAFCDALGLHDFDVVVNGSGINTALTALLKRPNLIRRLVLNDASPEFDGVGVARTTALGRRIAEPRSWDEAIAALKDLSGDEFPVYSSSDWKFLATVKWVEVDGRLVRDCDPALLDQTEGRDFHNRQAVYWTEFSLLNTTKVLLVRGENSSYVTTEIAQRMLERKPDLEITEAKGQGHVPGLHFDGLPEQVLQFLSQPDEEPDPPEAPA